MNLLSLYQKGKTATEIAKIIGVSRTVITKRLRKFGVKIRPSKYYLKANVDKDLIIDLYVNQLKSTKEIGKIFNLHDHSIRRILHEHKIYVIPATKQQLIKIDQVVLNDLYVTQRKSIDTIATQFGVQHRCISKKLKRYNIEIRKPIDHGLGISEGEKQLANFIRSLGHQIIINDRKIIKPYELDIVLPKLKLAIEYNGTYYHADPRFYHADRELAIGIKRRKITAKDRWTYDLMKKHMCESAGYNMITIWEHDWVHDQSKTKEHVLFLIS